jgi:site-specific DNA recombinase
MKSRTADGYIRVSRRGGREGESFISPDVQRKKIADWAALHDVEILAWWEEIDQSGAKLERPLFQEALARCERAETGGIVVARLDRFARSAIDALESIRRLNEAGARLVSVEDNFDGSTPMGRFAIGILTLIAELELERIKENWDSAVRSAVERGVHISARPPTGYRRGPDGRLLREEPAASAVAEVFQRRALGASWAELARYLEEQGVYPPTGNKHWSKVGVAGLVKNPVYLGQARSGKVVKEHAHEAIVSRAEFDAAQSTKKSVFAQRDGSLAAQAAATRSRSLATPSARPGSATRCTTAPAVTQPASAQLAPTPAPRSSTPTSNNKYCARSARNKDSSRKPSPPPTRSTN